MNNLPLHPLVARWFRERFHGAVIPRLFLALFFLAAVAGTAAAAEPKPKLPPVQRPIEAVNVARAYVVITGTVTVRVDGVLVNPADVTYSFDPDFKFSTGYLSRVGDGMFALRVDRVPAEEAYTLTIRAAYNDTLVRDGVVQRMGNTHTGSLRLPLPFGRDHSIGQQLLDLQ